MIHVVARTPFGSWISDGSGPLLLHHMHCAGVLLGAVGCGVRPSATPHGLPNTNHAGHQKPAGSAKVFRAKVTLACVAPAVTLETQCHTTPQPRLVSYWSSLPRVGYPAYGHDTPSAQTPPSRSPGSGVEVCATACCPPVLRFRRCWAPNPLTASLVKQVAAASTKKSPPAKKSGKAAEKKESHGKGSESHGKGSAAAAKHGGGKYVRPCSERVNSSHRRWKGPCRVTTPNDHASLRTYYA
jgi:hypothetical protein